ncbi:hypothetical protein MHSWG343_00540 [Candidatus Mycoplasma haematohominis]|uniref:Uncharacterized protein n=1 Tax=Candidatus Mycoplasma haematohominis TaxID=1494318 RepID=A0A478FRU0_9MOLU|nr:hypothetical protein MHSWG343_00540 [Candidatus Mycoplasma haemohominis]
MPSPAAVVGGALGAGAIGVGSAYLAGAFGGSGSLEVEIEPTKVLLSADSKFNTDYSTNNLIGKDYGNYLVAPVGSTTTETAETNNKAWWDWSYKRWKRDFANPNSNLSEEFKDASKVGSAFSDASSSSAALNKVCEAVYKKAKTEITSEDTPNNKAKLRNDLFKYCSIFGESFKTISEVEEEKSNYGSGNFGSDNTHSKTLIAVTGNDKFWAKRNEEFYSSTGNKKGDDSASKFFKKFYDENKTKKKNIRERCKEAYKKPSSTAASADESPNLGEVTKFCAI